MAVSSAAITTDTFRSIWVSEKKRRRWPPLLPYSVIGLSGKLTVHMFDKSFTDLSVTDLSVTGNLHHFIHRLHELIHLDGLGKISEESCLQSLFNVSAHGIGAERHYGNI